MEHGAWRLAGFFGNMLSENEGFPQADQCSARPGATADVKLDPLCIERSKPYLADTYETRSGPGVSGFSDSISCETTPKWHGFFSDQTGRLRPEAVLI